MKFSLLIGFASVIIGLVVTMVMATPAQADDAGVGHEKTIKMADEGGAAPAPSSDKMKLGLRESWGPRLGPAFVSVWQTLDYSRAPSQGLGNMIYISAINNKSSSSAELAVATIMETFGSQVFLLEVADVTDGKLLRTFEFPDSAQTPLNFVVGGPPGIFLVGMQNGVGIANLADKTNDVVQVEYPKTISSKSFKAAYPRPGVRYVPLTFTDDASGEDHLLVLDVVARKFEVLPGCETIVSNVLFQSLLFSNGEIYAVCSATKELTKFHIFNGTATKHWTTSGLEIGGGLSIIRMSPDGEHIGWLTTEKACTTPQNSCSSSIYYIVTATGKDYWENEVQQKSPDNCQIGGLNIDANFVGGLFIIELTCALFGFELTKGKVAWTQDIQLPTTAFLSNALEGGLFIDPFDSKEIFVRDSEITYYAIDVATGKVNGKVKSEWEYKYETTHVFLTRVIPSRMDRNKQSTGHPQPLLIAFSSEGFEWIDVANRESLGVIKNKGDGADFFKMEILPGGGNAPYIIATGGNGPMMLSPHVGRRLDHVFSAQVSVPGAVTFGVYVGGAAAFDWNGEAIWHAPTSSVLTLTDPIFLPGTGNVLFPNGVGVIAFDAYTGKMYSELRIQESCADPALDLAALGTLYPDKTVFDGKNHDLYFPIGSFCVNFVDASLQLGYLRNKFPLDEVPVLLPGHDVLLAWNYVSIVRFDLKSKTPKDVIVGTLTGGISGVYTFGEGNLFFVVTDQNAVCCYDYNGDLLWIVYVNVVMSISKATFFNDTLIVVGSEGIVGIDVRFGVKLEDRVVWDTHTTVSTTATPNVEMLPNGYLLVSASGGTQCFDVINRKIVWTQKFMEMCYLDFDHDSYFVYIGCQSLGVFAVNALNGDTLFTLPLSYSYKIWHVEQRIIAKTSTTVVYFSVPQEWMKFYWENGRAAAARPAHTVSPNVPIPSPVPHPEFPKKTPTPPPLHSNNKSLYTEAAVLAEFKSGKGGGGTLLSGKYYFNLNGVDEKKNPIIEAFDVTQNFHPLWTSPGTASWASAVLVTEVPDAHGHGSKSDVLVVSFHGDDFNDVTMILNASSKGERLWKKDNATQAIVNLATNASIVIISEKKQVTSYNLASGALGHQFWTPGNSPLELALHYTTTDAKNPILIVRTEEANIYGFEANTGVRKWNETTNGKSSVISLCATDFSDPHQCHGRDYVVVASPAALLQKVFHTAVCAIPVAVGPSKMVVHIVHDDLTHGAILAGKQGDNQYDALLTSSTTVYRLNTKGLKPIFTAPHGGRIYPWLNAALGDRIFFVYTTGGPIYPQNPESAKLVTFDATTNKVLWEGSFTPQEKPWKQSSILDIAVFPEPGIVVLSVSGVWIFDLHTGVRYAKMLKFHQTFRVWPVQISTIDPVHFDLNLGPFVNSKVPSIAYMIESVSTTAPYYAKSYLSLFAGSVEVTTAITDTMIIYPTDPKKPLELLLTSMTSSVVGALTNTGKGMWASYQHDTREQFVKLVKYTATDVKPPTTEIYAFAISNHYVRSFDAMSGHAIVNQLFTQNCPMLHNADPVGNRVFSDGGRCIEFFTPNYAVKSCENTTSVWAECFAVSDSLELDPDITPVKASSGIVVVGDYYSGVVGASFTEKRQAWHCLYTQTLSTLLTILPSSATPPSKPIPADEDFVVAVMRNHIVALRVSDGAPIWTYDMGFHVFSGAQVENAVVDDNGRLILQGSDGNNIFMTALRLDAGPLSNDERKIWSTSDLSSSFPLGLTFVPNTNLVIAVTEVHRIAVDVRTGDSIWTRTQPIRGSNCPVVLVPNHPGMPADSVQSLMIDTCDDVSVRIIATGETFAIYGPDYIQSGSLKSVTADSITLNYGGTGTVVYPLFAPPTKKSPERNTTKREVRVPVGLKYKIPLPKPQRTNSGNPSLNRPSLPSYYIHSYDTEYKPLRIGMGFVTAGTTFAIVLKDINKTTEPYLVAMNASTGTTMNELKLGVIPGTSPAVPCDVTYLVQISSTHGMYYCSHPGTYMIFGLFLPSGSSWGTPLQVVNSSLYVGRPQPGVPYNIGFPEPAFSDTLGLACINVIDNHNNSHGNICIDNKRTSPSFGHVLHASVCPGTFDLTFVPPVVAEDHKLFILSCAKESRLAVNSAGKVVWHNTSGASRGTPIFTSKNYFVDLLVSNKTTHAAEFVMKEIATGKVVNAYAPPGMIVEEWKRATNAIQTYTVVEEEDLKPTVLTIAFATSDFLKTFHMPVTGKSTDGWTHALDKKLGFFDGPMPFKLDANALYAATGGAFLRFDIKSGTITMTATSSGYTTDYLFLIDNGNYLVSATWGEIDLCDTRTSFVAQLNVDGGTLGSMPTVVDGVLVIVSETSYIQGYLATNALFAVPGSVLAFAGPTMYSVDNGVMYCLGKSGAYHWGYDFNDQNVNNVFAAPSKKHGTIGIAPGDGPGMVGVAQSSEILWQIVLPVCNGVSPSVTYADFTIDPDDEERVYFFADAPCLYILNVTSGEVITVTTHGSTMPITGTPIIDGEKGIIGLSELGDVFSFTRHATRSGPFVEWENRLGLSESGTDSPQMELVGSYLLVLLGSRVHFMSPGNMGRVLWTLPLAGNPAGFAVNRATNAIVVTDISGVRLFLIDPAVEYAKREVWFISAVDLLGHPYVAPEFGEIEPPPPEITDSGIAIFNFGSNIFGVEIATKKILFNQSNAEPCTIFTIDNSDGRLSKDSPWPHVFAAWCKNLELRNVYTGEKLLTLTEGGNTAYGNLFIDPVLGYVRYDGVETFHSLQIPDTFLAMRLALTGHGTMAPVPSVPLPTGTVSPAYRPQNLYTGVPALPPAVTLPSLGCVQSVEHLHANFVQCLDHGSKVLYPKGVEVPIPCATASSVLSKCIQTWLGGVVPNCEGALFAMNKMLIELNQSDVYGLCQRPHRCTDGAAGSRIMCKVVESAQNQIPHGETLYPKFTFPNNADQIDDKSLTLKPDHTSTSTTTTTTPHPTHTTTPHPTAPDHTMWAFHCEGDSTISKTVPPPEFLNHLAALLNMTKGTIPSIHTLAEDVAKLTFSFEFTSHDAQPLSAKLHSMLTYDYTGTTVALDLVSMSAYVAPTTTTPKPTHTTTTPKPTHTTTTPKPTHSTTPHPTHTTTTPAPTPTGTPLPKIYWEFEVIIDPATDPNKIIPPPGFIANLAKLLASGSEMAAELSAPAPPEIVITKQDPEALTFTFNFVGASSYEHGKLLHEKVAADEVKTASALGVEFMSAAPFVPQPASTPAPPKKKPLSGGVIAAIVLVCLAVVAVVVLLLRNKKVKRRFGLSEGSTLLASTNAEGDDMTARARTGSRREMKTFGGVAVAEDTENV